MAVTVEALAQASGQKLSKRQRKFLKMIPVDPKNSGEARDNCRRQLGTKTSTQIEEMLIQEFEDAKRGELSGIYRTGSIFLAELFTKNGGHTLGIDEDILLDAYQQMKEQALRLESYFAPLLKSIPTDKIKIRNIMYDFIEVVYDRYRMVYLDIPLQTKALDRKLLATWLESYQFCKKVGDEYFQQWKSLPPSLLKDFYAKKAMYFYEKATKNAVDVKMAWKEINLDTSEVYENLRVLKQDDFNERLLEANLQEPLGSHEFKLCMDVFVKIRDAITELLKSTQKDDIYVGKLKAQLVHLETLKEKTKLPEFIEIAIFLEENERSVQARLYSLEQEHKASQDADSQADAIIKAITLEEPVVNPLIFTLYKKKKPSLHLKKLDTPEGPETPERSDHSEGPSTPVQSSKTFEEPDVKETTETEEFKSLLETRYTEACQEKDFIQGKTLLLGVLQAAETEKNMTIKAAARYELANLFLTEAKRKKKVIEFPEKLLLYRKATTHVEKAIEICLVLETEKGTTIEPISELMDFSKALLEGLQKYTKYLEAKMLKLIQEHEQIKKEPWWGKAREKNPTQEISPRAQLAHVCYDNIETVHSLNQDISALLKKATKLPVEDNPPIPGASQATGSAAAAESYKKGRRHRR